MSSTQRKFKKSLFRNPSIRTLNQIETTFLSDLKKVLQKDLHRSIIGHLPEYISHDNISRPIILSKDIVIKIQEKHGDINPVNLLINIHDWDIVIKNIDHIPEKINLIKMIPDSNHFLLVGAIQENGFFILTHFETQVIQGNELKSLLGRGDFLIKGSRPGAQSLPIEALSQSEGVSDVKGNV